MSRGAGRKPVKRRMGMALDLRKLTENTGYFPGGTNIGLFTCSKDAYLIDSGNDKEAGRRLLSALNGMSLSLSAVINTHSNADHCGGNRFLQDRTGCRIIAPGIEAAVMRYPIIEPSLLYGGNPPDELRSKFFMAQPSEPVAEGLEALPAAVMAVELPGHYLGMCGYKTEDGVFFAADSLFSEQVLDKYHISFLYDVAAYLRTLESLASIECSIYVPSHAEPVEDIRPLAAKNIAKVNELAELACRFSVEPAGADDILKSIYDHYGMSLDIAQYGLAGSTIRSYLTYLVNEGRAERLVRDNRLLYRSN